MDFPVQGQHQSEGLLHRPQLLVAEHSLQGIEIGVGTQHEDAVELLLRLDLFGVDREVLLASRGSALRRGPPGGFGADGVRRDGCFPGLFQTRVALRL